MIRNSVYLLVELALLFLVVATMVEFGQRRLGAQRLRAWMGGPPVVAALKGIGVGFITPFCTFSALPLLVGLRRAGVTPAGYVAFIVAAPVLDPVLFGALAIIVGLPAALTYVAIAFTAAMGLALLSEQFDIERLLLPATLVAATDSGASSTRGEHNQPDDPWMGPAAELRAAGREAIVLMRRLGPVLVLGVLIGTSLEALVPPGAVADIAGANSGLAIPAAAALGTPLYFSTELFVPIADSLQGAGVGIGAIVALTIAGAGANIPEFLLLSKLAHRQLVVIFVGYVFLVAVIGGLVAQVVAA